MKLFVDYISQPSRAVLAFCLGNKISFELIETRVVRMDHLKPEFTKLNPNQAVPVLVDGNFALAESHAILAYLASSYGVGDHWYPKDLKQRAQIDSYLHWHHLNTRLGMSGYLYRKFLRPRIYNQQFPSNFEEELLSLQKRTLSMIDTTLKEYKFVGKTDQVSIADLACFCECEQLKMIDFDYKQYKYLSDWREEIKKLPGVMEAHEVFHKLLPRIREDVKKKLAN